MPRSKEQYDDIRQQKKHLIMETALELFAENGYHATSISQIAAKAKISKGLTYNYFSSKKEILDELMEHGFHEIYKALDVNHDGVLTPEEFTQFIRQNFKLLRENMQHWKLFFSLLLQPKISQSFAEMYEKKAAPIFNLFYGFLKAQGSTNPEGDLMAISSMLEGAFLYCVTAPDIFPIDKLEEAVIGASFKIANHKK